MQLVKIKKIQIKGYFDQYFAPPERLTKFKLEVLG